MTTLAAQFDANRARFRDFLADIDKFSADFSKIGENRPPEPRWDQVWFPRLDACAAYAMVRILHPKRIVEIGAGHSTRFMARAIRDGALSTEFISIDPEPRATIEGLAVERIAVPIQDVSLPTIDTDDILFVDSSHVDRPGSDVDHVFQRVLPPLPAGSIIHFHDVFLPDPYPSDWAYRRYNEQDRIAELLTVEAYEILFASHYVKTRMADTLHDRQIARLPLRAGAYENSLWLRKR